MAVAYRKAVDENVPYDQRLANYAGNKDAGKSEYQRALEVHRGMLANGDTEGANAAKRWSDQVNTSIGGIGSDIVSNRADQLNKITDTIGQKATAEPFQFKASQAPFQYNAQADPSYQAALREAKLNTQTAAGNTSAAMNARGIMDSTITTDRVGQQAQQQYGHVSDTILPQLMQQAYGRYQDQNNNDYRNQLANYNSGQDQVKNLTGYAGTLSGQNQQDFSNKLATNQDTRAGQAQDATFTGNYNDPHTLETQKQMLANSAAYSTASPEEQARLHDQNIALAKSIGATDTTGNGDYSFGPGTKTLGGRQVDIAQQNADSMEKERIAIGKWRESQANHQNAISNGQLGVSRQSNNNYAVQNLMNIWDKTGVAPEGIPGVKAGTPLFDKTGARQDEQLQNKQDKLDIKHFGTERDGMIGSIRAGKVALPDAMKQLNQDEQLGIYTPDLAEKLRSALRVLSNGQPIPGDTQQGPQVDLKGINFGSGTGGGGTVTGSTFGK